MARDSTGGDTGPSLPRDTSYPHIMSQVPDSDDDADSYGSSAEASIEVTAAPERIPLSTSVMLERLPPDQKVRLGMPIGGPEEPQAKPVDCGQADGSVSSTSHLATTKLASIPTPHPSTKITVRLLPVGSTPAITPRVHKISSHQKVSAIANFLKKKLRHKESIHLYIQSSFSPTPDETLDDLYRLFKTNNELIISYCFSVAFG